MKYLAAKANEGGSNYQTLLAKTRYLQIGYYLDNWKMNPFFMPKKVRYLIYPSCSTLSTSPIITAHNLTSLGAHTDHRSIIQSDTGESNSKAGDAKTANHLFTRFANPPRDTGPFAEALVLKASAGTTMLGTSGLMQSNDYIRPWREIQGVKTSEQPLTSDEVVNLWLDGFGVEFAETSCYVREFVWDGSQGTILPQQAGVSMDALTDAASYIKSVDWSSVLNS